VVQEAVEDRRGDDRVAGEDLGPFAVALVGGEDDRAVFVTTRHDLEEQRRAFGLEGQEADLVDDEEARPAEAREAARSASGRRLGEDEPGGA
jgi:hypothetical protein